MSRTEKHFGKLKKVENVLINEDWYKEQCVKAGYNDLNKYIFDTWEELFKGCCLFSDDTKYLFINNELYLLIEHEEDEYADIIKTWKNEDGTISFVAEFYNGGTCLVEVLNDSIKKLNK